MVTLFDSLSQQKKELVPIAPPRVSIYSCGPTVYARQHLGNMRPYVFADVLKRTLRLFGHEPRHVINITDVGHLTDDADQGDDKMELSAQQSGRRAEDIAAHFTELFQRDLALLSVQPPEVWAYASAHVPEQIAMVEKLEARGLTYATPDGVYFDTSRAERYGRFRAAAAATEVQERLVGAGAKRNDADFALWKLSPRESRRQMEWPSPWGVGFPGWHIECSAMASHHLGAQLDIHTGGVDHIPVHHENELAQSEHALGVRPWVRYWVHSEWVVLNSEKIGKSRGGAPNLDDVRERGIAPLAYRLLLLGARYRQRIDLSWQSLAAAQRALTRIGQALQGAPREPPDADEPRWVAFRAALADDLDTPRALAILHESRRDARLLRAMTDALGLGAAVHALDEQGDAALAPLLAEREDARRAGDFATADRLRDAIRRAGFEIRDTPAGARLVRGAK